MANAIDEMRGGSVDATIASGNYRCRLDSGEGACRLYVVRPQTAGCTFTLPNPAYIRPGAAPNFTVINKGPEAIEIRSFGAASIYTLAVNRAIEIRILIQGTDLWSLQGPFVVSSGTALNGDRKPFEITYTASSASAQTRVRNDVARQYGYVAADGPAAVMVTIKANVVIGGGTTTTASFDTGGWPAGTTMLVMMESGSRIAGCGGTGGLGAPVTGSAPTIGQSGGPAMLVRCNTAIVNAGVIAGGGGGGGGGARVFVGGVWIPGGSGGGGAGVPAGAGGARVSSFVGTEGSAGSLIQGGAPGQALPNGYSGGFGGFQGDAGASGIPPGLGAPASSAGPAIQVSTGITLTNILTGTQLGGTVTV